VAPTGRTGPLLDGAQQLGLHGQRQVADFIEEQGAAVCGLEEAFAVLLGAGEGPLAVAKELGFQQLLGDGAAVDGNEGAFGPHADIVDGPRHQLFAGAGFAPEHDRRHAACHLFDQVAHLLDGGAATGQA
jgi:hypothetical protein